MSNFAAFVILINKVGGFFVSFFLKIKQAQDRDRWRLYSDCVMGVSPAKLNFQMLAVFVIDAVPISRKTTIWIQSC